MNDETRRDTPADAPESAQQTPPEPSADGPAPVEAALVSPEELAAIQVQLDQAKQQAEEYLDQARRARAELLNYKRRVEQEMLDLRKQANAQLILKLLPVLDDFHLAIAKIPAEERERNPWIQGLLLIERKLWSVLEGEGVEPIQAVGEPFSPERHEAIAMEEGEGDEHVVVEELRRGYLLHGRVLRPALVRVGRRPRQEPGKQEAEAAAGESVQSEQTADDQQQ
jgi:molecular chaperone GrpE